MSKALVLLCLPLLSLLGHADESAPALFWQPAVSRTHVAFRYAGDLWIVGREGGDAKRLTTMPGVEARPVFSPDGTQVAFTSGSGEGADVYVVPTAGGEPHRLTYHASRERHGAVGWTPDGKSVIGYNAERLFSVPAEGGRPIDLPLPSAVDGSFSPDGTRIAYIPFSQRRGGIDQYWRGYRGGGASRIWIANLPDCRIEKIPRADSYDFNPMWIGDRVYFLSDRNGPMALFAYDVASRKVASVLDRPDSDILSASSGPGAIVYATLGSLQLYDLETKRTRRLTIRIRDRMPLKASHFADALDTLAGMRLSPRGDRVLIEARGELSVLPVGHGQPQNLTNTPGAMERFPAWSPDGVRVAYFSDESGEYALHVRNSGGTGAVRKIDLGQPPGFYFSPIWSPDSRKLAYWDQRLSLWYVDVEEGTPVRIDRDALACEPVWTRIEAPPPAWSPDGRWLAYSKVLENNLRALHIYSLQAKRSWQVTDGMADVRSPQFDRGGRYLYFTASTDTGPTLGGELSTWNRRPTHRLHMAYLAKNDSPPAATGHAATEPMAIDPAGLESRIVALAVPARTYARIVAGGPGVLFLVETVAEPQRWNPGAVPSTDRQNLLRFELEAGRTDTIVEGVRDIDLPFDGETVLYRRDQKWIVSPARVAPRSQDVALTLESLQVHVDPPAEWKQMFREVWRISRDFFYDPGHHGVDWNARYDHYEPYLDAVSDPSDLNYLLYEMLADLRASHTWAWTGSEVTETTSAGVLGADYEIANGRYRIARIYGGDKWDPRLRAPLAQLGLDLRQGDYLLAVDGREVRSSDNIHRFLLGKTDKEVVLRVSADPTGNQARDITVVPAASDWGLRDFAWAEENRRKVERLTGGRVAYLYLPNTGAAGLAAFERYFYAQADKDAIIIDERFNKGGALADSIIGRLGQRVLAAGAPREGRDGTVPFAVIRGPKVMITNEAAGSGGDHLPRFFRQAGLGPLIGTRTLGLGTGGGGGLLTLMDGGEVAVPFFGTYAPGGSWVLENEGVAPDIEVEQDPAAVRAGHDPQLEKAVEVVLTLLKRNPPPVIKRPPYKKLQ